MHVRLRDQLLAGPFDDPVNGHPWRNRPDGDKFTGTFEFTVLEGDCVSKPVTKVRVFGEGILHG